MSTQVDVETFHAVTQTLHLYDHFVDGGEWSELSSIVTDDFALTTPSGAFTGVHGITRYEQAAGDHLPAHHVLNTLVEAVSGRNAVRAWSRYLLVTWEYGARVGDYLDLLVPEGDGWRLASRVVLPRGAGGTPEPEHGSFAAWRSVGA